MKIIFITLFIVPSIALAVSPIIGYRIAHGNGQIFTTPQAACNSVNAKTFPINFDKSVYKCDQHLVIPHRGFK